MNRNTLLFVLAGLAMLVGLLGLAPAAHAAHALTIESAEITDVGTLTLTVSGDRRGGNPTVTVDVRNETGTVLATTIATNTGQGKIKTYTAVFDVSGVNACSVSAIQTKPDDGPVFADTTGARPDACDQQPQVCTISVVPTDLAFGNVQVDTTSDPQTTTVSNSGGADCTVTVTQTGSADFSAAPLTFTVAPAGSQDITVAYTPDIVGADSGTLAVGSNDPDTSNVDVMLSGNGVDNQGGNAPIANDDNFVVDTTVIDRNGQSDVTAPGVLINDTDPDAGDIISAVPASGTTNAGGSYNLLADGSFSYIPPTPTFTGDDSFSYNATDGTNTSLAATVNLPVQTNLQVNTATQNKFNIMMNYELGMHCTGFEFAYCCVLPPYNSIITQVARSDKGQNDSDFPMLLEGDPNVGLDALGRETVLREPQLNGNGDFNKYVMRYWHDAQPRNDGRGKPQSSVLISAVEGNSMFMWNTLYDAAATDAGNKLITGTYQGSTGVVLGDGDYTDANDNYGSGWMNHFYIYSDLEGGNPTNTSAEVNKIRLGLENLTATPAGGVPGTAPSLVIPDDCGPAFHPMGPDTQNGDPNNPVVDNTCGGFANGNLLTFSTDHGTVVYTQMKVLENLPVMLTSPRIWEALGLPLTPFEDTIDFFADPGLVDEDSIRPYVQMKAQLHNYDPGVANGVGTPVIDDGNPVIGFGTAPIDIPNCERCHSELQATSQNSAQQIGGRNDAIAADVQLEIDYWMNFYGLSEAAGDSTWYPRLKGAAISILAIHDAQHGTSFTANWPGDPDDPNNPGFGSDLPQNTRLGGESVICQKCHADNVIAAVKSANGPGGALIPPITEAIHDNHRNVSDGGLIVFADSQGRDGGCQGCHPAHRSDGDMAGYPITIEGDNFYQASDNRDANGGCFVGRDVHSNPGKDSDGAETPEHLNAVGQYLATNVFSDQGPNGDKGIWCTNCHTQLGQEIWRSENMVDLVHGVPGKEADLTTDAVNIRALPTLTDIALAVGLDTNPLCELEPGVFADPTDCAIAMLDPTADNPIGDLTRAIWRPDVPDANVATLEVASGANGCDSQGEYPTAVFNDRFQVHVCVKLDVDGDPSVRILEGFCTTPDCVTLAQNTLDAEGNGSTAVPVPMDAATDGRDHWLSPGEPHCADCHAAPYVEQSGNINAFPPFNYPRKASLMRYSRGHQDISCQGCHESIHGLYPVTPTIDTTSYAQAANLNADGSHGPVKCDSCHQGDGNGIPTWLRNSNRWDGGQIGSDFDAAVTWAHTYTDEQSVLESTCLNCHGVEGNNWSDVDIDNKDYLEHASKGGSQDLPRSMMDKAEIELYGEVFSSNDGSDGVCLGCHEDESDKIGCTGEDGEEWKLHLTEGRVAQSTWEAVAEATGHTCGW